MTADSIFSEISAYLLTSFGADLRKNWYVGIASDINQRLFEEHNVNRLSRGWIWRRAFNAEHARAAEALLLERGHDGGSGGGDHTCTFVYAFRMEPGTIR